MIIEAESWLPSGSTPIEEILMSGLGEGPSQFGVHWCSLWTEKKY